MAYRVGVDVGGTFTDFCEFPIYIPTVAVTSIGAGGGSIAWVDDLGVLKVGPESAGSSPGPACYGRGGERPTITDAFAVLGYIGQFELDNSAISIDADMARAAVSTVAEPIGRSTEEAAQAIVDIAVSGMYVEVSKLISRDGIDHREFGMQAFGGAGPMLACFLAKELGMTHVVIPPTPGVLSALGGLIADIKNDFIATVFLDLDEDAMPLIRDTCAALESQAVQWLCEEHGYGSPLEREAERVLTDVRRGFVTADAARAEYGVVIADDAVDEEETRALRKQMAAADSHRGFGYSEARKAHELVWTQKNYEVLTEILARMPVDWRFFVKHRVFDAIERMPEDERTGTGEEVRRAFTVLAAEYPELAEHAAD